MMRRKCPGQLRCGLANDARELRHLFLAEPHGCCSESDCAHVIASGVGHWNWSGQATDANDILLIVHGVSLAADLFEVFEHGLR